MTSSQRWALAAAIAAAGVLVYLLRPVLLPFLVGALLAYLGSPLVDRLVGRGLPRTPAVTAVFAVVVMLLAGLVLVLVPLVGAQIDYLQRTLPELLAWVQENAGPWIESRFGVDPRGVIDLEQIGALIREHWQASGNVAREIVARATRSGLAFTAFVLNAILTPVVAFYLMRDWHTLVDRVRGLLPRPIEPTAVGLARECNEVLGAFLRGQLLVMLALGAFYSAALWLLGLDLALLVGTLAGVFSIVPYLGTILGIAAGLIAGLFQFSEWWPLIAILGVFAIGNVGETLVLQPWLVGDRIGLHPVAVIFAVLAGGQLFGFVGVLLALPAAAVLMVLLRHAHERYRGSDWYGGGEA